MLTIQNNQILDEWVYLHIPYCKDTDAVDFLMKENQERFDYLVTESNPERIIDTEKTFWIYEGDRESCGQRYALFRRWGMGDWVNGWSLFQLGMAYAKHIRAAWNPYEQIPTRNPFEQFAQTEQTIFNKQRIVDAMGTLTAMFEAAACVNYKYENRCGVVVDNEEEYDEEAAAWFVYLNVEQGTSEVYFELGFWYLQSCWDRLPSAYTNLPNRAWTYINIPCRTELEALNFIIATNQRKFQAWVQHTQQKEYEDTKFSTKLNFLHYVKTYEVDGRLYAVAKLWGRTPPARVVYLGAEYAEMIGKTYQPYDLPEIDQPFSIFPKDMQTIYSGVKMDIEECSEHQILQANVCVSGRYLGRIAPEITSDHVSEGILYCTIEMLEDVSADVLFEFGYWYEQAHKHRIPARFNILD